MSARIAWTDNQWGETGRAGGFNLFSISWGTRRDPELHWTLSTTLPLRSKHLGQVHASKDDAKAAAERVLEAFIRKLNGTAS